MTGFDYYRPHTAERACQLKRSLADARYVSGGTDLLVQIKNGVAQPEALISLRQVDELRGIETAGETTWIGAATPVAEVIDHSLVRKRHPVLAEALGLLGSEQIRSVATIGGNLSNASPCADSAPPLLVYGARLRLVGPDGEREVAMAELFVGPGQTCLGPHELLAAIGLGPPPIGSRGLFMKKRRVRMDLAQVNLAVLLVLAPDGTTCRSARIAAGAVAPVPLRLREVESLLAEKKLDARAIDEAAELAAQCISPISDIRASADYRRAIVRAYLRRALSALRQGRSS